MVRLSGEFVQMDPRTWNSHFDVEVNVALGAGSDQERVATLQMFSAKQEEILKEQGPNNPIAGFGQYMNTLRKIVELTGFKDVQNYVGNPDYNPALEQAEEEPTPEQVLAQVQAQQIQAQMQIEAARLQQEREEMLLKDDRDRDKMEAEMQLKVAELESRYNTSIDVAAIKAAIERERMRKTDA